MSIKVSRRAALLTAGAVACAALSAAGVVVARDGWSGFVKEVLTEHFGREVALHHQTERFVVALKEEAVGERGLPQRLALEVIFDFELDRMPIDIPREDWLRERILFKFLTSTNVIRHRETGVELVFAGLFDPVKGICGNMLGASGGGGEVASALSARVKRQLGRGSGASLRPDNQPTLLTQPTFDERSRCKA